MILRKRKKLKEINMNNIPKHLAIILDGNGRWARKRGMPRNYGHKEGAQTLLKTASSCSELGVKYLTVYAFSTENWTRPSEEVNYLMNLPLEFFDKVMPEVLKNNIKVSFIGKRDGLNQELIDKIEEVSTKTKDCTGLHMIIALNYGSRDEIVSATKELIKDVIAEKIDINEINESIFSSKLFTNDIPDVDLLIRTSGEIRLSNYLLWQIAYSEMYFTNTLWPDFNEKELHKAILSYQNRNRRFGGLKEDLQ